MKAFLLFVVTAIVFGVWYYCGNLPPAKLDEGARLLAEAADREKANAADREARAKMVERLRSEADCQKMADQLSQNSTLAQDDTAMAQERLRSWRQKTSPNHY